MTDNCKRILNRALNDQRRYGLRTRKGPGRLSRADRNVYRRDAHEAIVRAHLARRGWRAGGDFAVLPVTIPTQRDCNHVYFRATPGERVNVAVVVEPVMP